MGIRTDDARPADPLEGLLAALGPRELRADLARAIHALRLRVKELTALHGAAELLQDDARSEEETLTQIALLLPSALQFPAIAVGRVTLGDSSFATPDWKDTPWNLRASFHTDDGQEGAVEAAYVRAAPPSAEVPFLAEERKLLDSLARMIAAAIGRRRALEQIRYLVAGGRVRMFEWDVARDRFTWPGLTELGDDGQPRPLTRNREGAFAAIHPDDREEVERTVDATFQQPRADGFSAEYRAALPGGPYTRRLLTGRILRDATGRPTRVVGVSTDVTEQRACQDRMRQGEKMEALGRVASGISHDFNNVLLMMMGHAELAAGRLAEGDRARHHVEEVLRAGQAAADLTKQILAFSRRQELKPRVVDLGKAAADAISMIGPLLGSRVSLKLEPRADAPPAVVDPTQFQQVLLNLCVNARDAMPRGGKITVRVRGTRCGAPQADGRASEPRDWATLEVEDTGVGMSPRVSEQIFEPFFTTKAEDKGTGLGLATVHGIVTQSGGFLEVESEVGRGTLFRVHFPVPDSAEPE